MSEETKKILKLIKKIHTQLFAVSHECGNVKWMAPEYDKHFGDFSTKFINKEFSEFEKKEMTMSEETKKILNVIFYLITEVKKGHFGVGVLPPGLAHPIYQSTLKEIHKQFPEFKPGKE